MTSKKPPLWGITLQQPWASALFYGRPVESRIRADGRCPYPQIALNKPLAIHAGLKTHPWAPAAYQQLPRLPEIGTLPYGAIIGDILPLRWLRAEDAAAIPELASWVIPDDPERWYLQHDPERAVLYPEPIPRKGTQGVWRV